MVNLYFENRFGERRFVCECEENQVVSNIYAEVESMNPNYRIYYVRSWKNEEGETIWDCGSWSENFVSIPVCQVDRQSAI